MSAGARHTLISFQRATTTQDDYGEEVSTWTTLATEWAQVFWGRGDERRQAAAEQGSQSATFQVLSNGNTRSLTLRDRLVMDGFIWDVVGIAPDTPRRGHIELTATATFVAYAPPSGEFGQFDFSHPANSGLLALILEDA